MRKRTSWFSAVLAVCALVCTGTFAKDKEKEKPKSSGTMVDSGTFGVFSSGMRVATETFSIEQSGMGSVISSQFKSAQGEQVAEQSSELQLTPSVELRKYVWRATAPEKINASVVPNDAFLIESFTTGAESKQQNQNFLLPASTLILDDYFFVQREVLAWKFLASACKSSNGTPNCAVHQKAQFGALNPHARTPMSLAVEFTGREKLTLHGAEQECSKFMLTSDTGNWVFWLDDKLKIVRLLNDGGTEVVRD